MNATIATVSTPLGNVEVTTQGEHAHVALNGIITRGVALHGSLRLMRENGQWVPYREPDAPPGPFQHLHRAINLSGYWNGEEHIGHTQARREVILEKVLPAIVKFFAEHPEIVEAGIEKQRREEIARAQRDVQRLREELKKAEEVLAKVRA